MAFIIIYIPRTKTQEGYRRLVVDVDLRSMERPFIEVMEPLRLQKGKETRSTCDIRHEKVT